MVFLARYIEKYIRQSYWFDQSFLIFFPFLEKSLKVNFVCRIKILIDNVLANV